MNRTMRTCAAAIVAVTVIAGSGIGSADPVTIEAAVTSGTRTFTLSSLTGSSLDSIALGTSGSAGFVSNVTDARYSRVGYQVTANLSDLYKVSGSTYDCTKRIASSNFTLGFLASPIALTDIAALVDPVWDLTGTVSGALATSLGVASGTAVTVSNLAAERAEHTLAGAFTGIEDALPIKVAAGSGGAFTSPAPHAGCAPTPGGTATSRLLMDGTGSDLSALFAWVQDALTDAADVNGNGTVTATELASSGVADDATLAEAVRTALGASGVALAAFDTLIAAGTITMTQIYDTLSATLEPVTSLVGQSGTYLASPKVSSSIPSGTSAGTYRGTLTVTLVDVP